MHRWVWRLFLIPGAMWLVVLFVVPVGFIVAVSFGTVDIVGAPVYGWHPGNYTPILQSIYIRVLLRSLTFALATTVICILLGYPVAYFVVRFGGRYKGLLLGLVILPWFVDYLVRIYAWVSLLGDQGFLNGLLHAFGMPGSPPLRLINTPYAVIGGLTYDYLPFMILPLFAVLDQIGDAVIEAGKDLYGTPAQTFFRVTLPMSLPGLMAGCVLVFLPSAGDFATAQLLGGPNSYMMGNLIDGVFEGGGFWPFGAALTALVLAVLFVPMLLYVRYALRGGGVLSG